MRVEKPKPESEASPEETPKRELVERQLAPEEVEGFKNEMDEYTAGLQARVLELQTELSALQKMSPEYEHFARYAEIEAELKELREQIDGLTDSSKAIDEQGDAAVITIQE